MKNQNASNLPILKDGGKQWCLLCLKENGLTDLKFHTQSICQPITKKFLVVLVSMLYVKVQW